MQVQVLRLENTVFVEAREEDVTLQSPRYYPGGLSVDVGSPMDQMEHERFVLDETVGSVDWLSPAPVDEFRFDRSTLLLKRLSLTIPEHSEKDSDLPRLWLSVGVASVTLRLLDPIGDFFVDPAVNRWCDDRYLVVLRSNATTGAGERLRLGVAPGIQLLFEGGILAGWILEEPERRIATIEGGTSFSPEDPELAAILSEYLGMMTFPLLDGLENGDSRFREALENLVDRLCSDAGATDRRESLRRVIEDLIEYWYI